MYQIKYVNYKLWYMYYIEYRESSKSRLFLHQLYEQFVIDCYAVLCNTFNNKLKGLFKNYLGLDLFIYFPLKNVGVNQVQ